MDTPINQMDFSKNKESRLRALILGVKWTQIAKGVNRTRQWVTDYMNSNVTSSYLDTEIPKYLDQIEEDREEEPEARVGLTKKRAVTQINERRNFQKTLSRISGPAKHLELYQSSNTS